MRPEDQVHFCPPGRIVIGCGARTQLPALLHRLGYTMKYNMNLTFPIADWFLGTSDLRRGLIGHLFNGYSEKHIKQELKPIIAKFRNDDSRVTLDGPQLTPPEESLMAGGTAAGRRAMAR